jgi:hypothetical protein
LDTERFPYTECVGSLLYLSVCTRPDIAQAIGALARYTAGPPEAHWEAAFGIVRYLAGTAAMGLTYGRSDQTIEAFCDGDYAGDVDTRRSTTGYVFLMYGGGSQLVEPPAANSGSIDSRGGIFERSAGGEGGAVVPQAGEGFGARPGNSRDPV